MAEDDWTDLVNGGVPPGGIFACQLDDMRLINELKRETSPFDRLAELLIVGAASYFEAFWKDQVATIINIAPSLVRRLEESGHNVSLRATEVVQWLDRSHVPLGFLVAEKMNFGSAERVNKIFMSLLKVTPFSKVDSRRYSEMQRDRNLLVHHGGSLTTSYLLQTARTEERPYWNSASFGKKDASRIIEFTAKIALKSLRVSKAALERIVEREAIDLSAARKACLDHLDMWL